MSRVVFSLAEKDSLLELVTKYKSIVENKETNKIQLGKREKTWEKITDEFNALPDVHHLTVKQVRKLWDNLKCRAKQEFAQERKRIFKTGGGEDEADDEIQLTERSEKVKDIIGPQLIPLENDFDDDVPEPTTKALEITPEERALLSESESEPEVVSNTSKSGVTKPHNAVKKKRGIRAEKQDENLGGVFDNEFKEHKLRVKKLKMDIDNTQAVHEKKMEILQLEKKYWEQKVLTASNEHTTEMMIL